ncbi:MAG TPA: hypothetical protein VH814_20385 [Steroidobacteraceae bacterium]|jgi:hypothetical protein
MRSKGNPLRSTIFAALCALPALLLGSQVCVRAAEEAAPEPVQAIWKDQEISFFFQTQTTFYSCSSLEAKLERILKALGATARVKVRSVDCTSGRLPRMPRVVVEVHSPVEATPEALAERDKSKGTRELAARVRGEKEDPEALAPFPAQWKHVQLKRGSVNLEPGDCELIDELRRKVLPKLAVRLVKDNTHCTPHQLTLGQPQLEVLALTALPKPDAPKKSEESK